MPINCYDLGDVVHLVATFGTDQSPVVDPTTVTFKLKAHGVNQVLLYGTDAQVIKDSTGVYHVDVSTTVKGMHFYRWESTGVGQSAEEGQFLVKDTPFS